MFSFIVIMILLLISIGLNVVFYVRWSRDTHNLQKLCASRDKLLIDYEHQLTDANEEIKSVMELSDAKTKHINDLTRIRRALTTENSNLSQLNRTLIDRNNNLRTNLNRLQDHRIKIPFCDKTDSGKAHFLKNWMRLGGNLLRSGQWIRILLFESSDSGSTYVELSLKEDMIDNS